MENKVLFSGKKVSLSIKQTQISANGVRKKWCFPFKSSLFICYSFWCIIIIYLFKKTKQNLYLMSFFK